MRKIFITEFMSLDGVFEAPGPDGSGYKYAGWTFPYNTKEFGTFKFDELQATDALLLGRVTYDGFAKAWPNQKDPSGFADKFNTMPKYVVSKTLAVSEWNNSHIIKSNVVESIKALDGTLAVHGSGTLARFLLNNKLVDEMTILMYPVILSTGKRLFADMHKTNLKLIETKTLEKGVVVLRYVPE